MNPVLIDLGFMQIRWYSLLILISFGVGYLLIIQRCKKKGVPPNIVSDMFFYLVITGILGARIYYCLFNMDYYKSNLLNIFKIWQGGLAIHGGVIFGAVFVYFYTKRKQLKYFQMLDIFAPALVLGQAIGRWGNFFNAEAFGSPTTFEALKSLHIPQFIIKGMYINNTYYHPTFLYESIGCLLIFILLLVIRDKKNIKEGQIISIYFVLYGAIRFFIEGLRQDSLMFQSIKAAQLVSSFMIFIGICIFICSLRRNVCHDKQ